MEEINFFYLYNHWNLSKYYSKLILTLVECNIMLTFYRFVFSYNVQLNNKLLNIVKDTESLLIWHRLKRCRTWYKFAKNLNLNNKGEVPIRKLLVTLLNLLLSKGVIILCSHNKKIYYNF